MHSSLHVARTPLTWLALAVVSGASGALAAPGIPGPENAPPEPHASVRLVTADDGIRPGDTVQLGLTFAIEPGWHLYWQGRNDTGLYPMVTWETEGPATVGDLVWPVPERKVSPGRILDHVYHDRLTLLVPVTVDGDAVPGDEVVVRGDVSWVVCREACFSEQGTVELRLAVGGDGAAGAADPGAASLLDDARSRLPEPLPPREKTVALGRTGDSISLRVANAAGLSFFPSLDCVGLADPIRDAQAAGSRLDLELDAPAADARLKGVLEVHYEQSGSVRHFALDLPLPAPAG